MEDNERALSRNDNHICLRKETLHRCPFGQLESIYYKYGKAVVASTKGKQKRKSNIERIDGILLSVMLVASLRTPF
jgi:hypothetical protein